MLNTTPTPGGKYCQRCNGLLLPDHSRDSVGPVCVNCGRPAYVVPPEVLVSLAAERRPNRKVGPQQPLPQRIQEVEL